MVADSLHWGAVFSSIRANKRLDSCLFLSISNINSANEGWSGGSSSSLPPPWFRQRATELRLTDDILRSGTKDEVNNNYRMQHVAQGNLVSLKLLGQFRRHNGSKMLKKRHSAKNKVAPQLNIITQGSEIVLNMLHRRYSNWDMTLINQS